MEGPYKPLPAKPAKLPNRACSAGRSLYDPSMPYFLGFQTKCIWNPLGIPAHPVQIVFLYFSPSLDSWLAHCAPLFIFNIPKLNFLSPSYLQRFLPARIFSSKVTKNQIPIFMTVQLFGYFLKFLSCYEFWHLVLGYFWAGWLRSLLLHTSQLICKTFSSICLNF